MKIQQKAPKPLSLKKMHENKNKVLIVRQIGGLGDILMHRMMFEDFKRVLPEGKIVFACPAKYHDAVKYHPFIDEVLDSAKTDISEYIIHYNTSSACTRHELSIAPLADKHRSDIWANHCGVILTKHNMHFNFDEQFKEQGKKILKHISNNFDGPIAIVCPVSAMLIKNLTPEQIKTCVNNLKSKGCFVCFLHSRPIVEMPEIPTIYGISVNDWMAVINAADYVVAVDTAAIHMAGGLGKPSVGIFTFADGKVYGKWYENFTLVQKHRDDGWDCGPCYNWSMCTKTKTLPKPCLTEITQEMINKGIDSMFDKFGRN